MIVINGGPSPQDIYFTNRKGWTIESEKMIDTDLIDSLFGLGAKHLIIDKTKATFTFTQNEIEYSDNYHDIYNLGKQ
ncbi:MAG: hypothetical protein ACR2GN_09500 [Bacteroidia bacterium]